jgi:hypothetical protein
VTCSHWPWPSWAIIGTPQPIDDIDFLDRGYVGGLAGLERDWHRWLQAEAAPLQF